jgi:hypothetical protein
VDGRRLFDLADGLSLGLLLVAMSAGAPFLPRLAVQPERPTASPFTDTHCYASVVLMFI